MTRNRMIKLTPIEEQFLNACLKNSSNGYKKKEGVYILNSYGYKVKIICQARIDKYRVDFLFIIDNKENFIVECDGHEFHEKTKEQVIKDNIRDRELLMLNIPVIRFSGSEVYKNADKLADEILINYIALRSRK